MKLARLLPTVGLLGVISAQAACESGERVPPNGIEYVNPRQGPTRESLFLNFDTAEGWLFVYRDGPPVQKISAPLAAEEVRAFQEMFTPELRDDCRRVTDFYFTMLERCKAADGGAMAQAGESRGDTADRGGDAGTCDPDEIDPNGQFSLTVKDKGYGFDCAPGKTRTPIVNEFIGALEAYKSKIRATYGG